MDRLPQHPAHLHSHSTPTLIHHHNQPDPSDDSNQVHSSFFSFFSSPQPTTAEASSSSAAATASPSQHQPYHHHDSEETWFEFLRDGANRDSVAREPTLLSSAPAIHRTGSGSGYGHGYGYGGASSSAGASSGSSATRPGARAPGEQSEARKRRLTAPDGSGRTGYGPSLGAFGSLGGVGPAGSADGVVPGSLPSGPSMLASGVGAGGGIVDLTGGAAGSRLTPAQQQQSSFHQQQYSAGMSGRGGSGDMGRSVGRASAAAAAMDRGMGRRGSDIVLPPWQPDSEVTRCPVCGRQFSFIYRKHHCRKCGRVICGTCSAHRIRIPRQFIVHPPSPVGASIIDLTEDEEDDLHQSLGGDEEVRVCNPCVPDPNFSPPPQPQPSYPYSFATLPFGASIEPSLIDRNRNTAHPAFPARPGFMPHHRPSLSDVSGSRQDVTRQRHHEAFRHHRDQYPDLWPPRFDSNNEQGPSFPQAALGSTHSHRHTSSTGSYRSSPAQYHPAVDNQGQFPPFLLPQSTPLPPSPPRRQIPEEDECPVCGNELPPKGPNGEETEREAHIVECIETSYAPSSSLNTTPASAEPSAAESAAAGTSAAGSTPPSAGGTGTPPQRQSSVRARRHTGNRMLVYRATEKDCVGDEGEPQECVICFEEFEEGVEMGRLECLCKFHRACIRKWWETKGVGSCPTHQLHE